MIYVLIPDSPGYIEWVANRPPVVPLLLQIFKIFGPLRFDAFVLFQVSLIVTASLSVIKRLSFDNKLLRNIATFILIGPALYWGIQIGTDAVGYALFLFAIANAGENKYKFILFAVLATLTRWQYVALFAFVILDVKYIHILIVFLAAMTIGIKIYGLSPMSRLHPMRIYTNCLYDKKPYHMSHHKFFDQFIADQKSVEQYLIPPCTNSNINYTRAAIVIRSKIYENFRIHQFFIFPLLLLFPIVFVRQSTTLAILMYAMVFIFSSPYHQRYTFMSETILATCIVKIADWIKSRK